MLFVPLLLKHSIVRSASSHYTPFHDLGRDCTQSRNSQPHFRPHPRLSPPPTARFSGLLRPTNLPVRAPSPHTRHVLEPRKGQNLTVRIVLDATARDGHVVERDLRDCVLDA